MDTLSDKNNDSPTVGSKKALFSWSLLIGFIFFQIIFISLTLPLLVFYGPFSNVKTTVVNSLMTSRRGHYIAEFFLKPSEIKRITESSSIKNIKQPITKDEFLSKRSIRHSSEIEYIMINGRMFTGHLLIIHDPFRVKIAYSEHLGKMGETTSAIARKNAAIAAINAGVFNDPKWTSTGGMPIGVIMHDGKVVFSDSSPDSKRDVVGITGDGSLIVGQYSTNEAAKMGVKEAVSYFAPLVINGEGVIKRGDGGFGIAPRTAIGQRKNDGAILLLVADGRRLDSIGATLLDLQKIMLQYGAYNAANLDGGSSTTMYYNGKVINNPSDALGERMVPTAFIVEK